ncbi:MAG TPA: urea ABC transporter permease subunit UrtB [Verrucomicrobiae bacterium]
MQKWIIVASALLAFSASAAELAIGTRLAEAITTQEAARQSELIRSFVETNDPYVKQVLEAWRGGLVQLFDSGGTNVPVLLESETDNEGRARARRISDGEFIKDGAGAPMLFGSLDLTPADTSSKLRKQIKVTLDIFSLVHSNPKMRRDAVIKLGQEQNPDYLPFFEERLTKEKSKEVEKALQEAVAVTHIASLDTKVRVPAIEKLGALRSINSLSFLKSLHDAANAAPEKFDKETSAACRKAIYDIEQYIWLGNLFGTAFRGLSLSAVLLVAALGLAITFGLMGVINMAHGEIIMIGAYATYVTQNVFQTWAVTNPAIQDYYFIAALVVSFVSAGIVGLILERSIIRWLYKRPLESLLATWGVSLVLQQVFRHTFGAANVQVNSPGWLSGSFVISDVLLAFNRLFVIAFAVFIIGLTYWLLTRTSLGLQIRAVMQNRSMASALGVRTDRVNMMTFAFGSGLAGMAGACLSQIGNVGPSLGQNYIVDCFMVVVLGGVGNLVGTVSASLGIGVTDQILQPWLGAVMGKITVLAAIILFLQWRPAGLFVTRSRSLEG